MFSIQYLLGLIAFLLYNCMSFAQTCDTIFISSIKESKENLCFLVKCLAENRDVEIELKFSREKDVEDLFFQYDTIVNEVYSLDDDPYTVIRSNLCDKVNGFVICYDNMKISKVGLLYEGYDNYGTYEGNKIYLWLHLR